ncbi:hypothetical protein [Lysobacter gummosus]|uniref:hypothetical protein n=1 Tax=Lysobacter gummosus TaxID=262324 RepID=UPI00364051DC
MIGIHVDRCSLICRFAFARHSRERGNPGPFVRERLKSLDARLRRSKAEPAFAGMTSLGFRNFCTGS